MAIFSGLFKSRDKPQNRTSGSGYSFFFGGSSAGKRVNERSAMQITAVYSCVRILAEAVAGLPLQSTFGGSGNSNKIAVLEEGMKYTLEPWLVRWEQSIQRKDLIKTFAFLHFDFPHRSENLLYYQCQKNPYFF